ncbi:MAG: hypothetical protein JWP36_483 [Paucimonas sp.]|nr:hypothetical protein [Paucimonas sp.]
MNRLRLGIAGALAPGRSVHSATLRRAACLAIARLQAATAIDLVPVWADDEATAAGGSRAARQLLDAGVAAVVGHYASSAALAAIESYGKHGIPLFLPAATAAALTERPGVFRLCDNDEDYCRWFDRLVERPAGQDIGLFCDGSVHATSVTNQLRGLSQQYVPDRRSTHCVYIGSYANSLEFARGCRAFRPEVSHLYLCDDVMAPSAQRDFTGLVPQVVIGGFDVLPRTPDEQALAAACRALWQEEPGSYFFETVAAVEAAVHWCTKPAERELAREARPLRFARITLGHAPGQGQAA